MAQLRRPVPLHDIEDADAYVSTVVRRLRLTLSAELRAELECEGLAILLQLAADWNGGGTFSGYVSSLLDKRLLSAWCEMEGCSRRRVKNEDGKWTGERRWVKPPVSSLDEVLARPGFDERRLARV